MNLSQLVDKTHAMRSFKLFTCSLSCAALLASAVQAGSPIGASEAAPGLQGAAIAFKGYVLDSIDKSLAAARSMNARVDAKDLQGAQQAWLAARSGWERSEIVSSEYFPELDRKIDAWPDADRGFHAVEAHLFGAHDVNAGAPSSELVANMVAFKERVNSASFTPQGLINGAARLAYEIGEDKSSGGESPFSGNSLSEIRDNIACIEAVYQRVFAPALKQKGGEAAAIVAHLKQLRATTGVGSIAELDQITLRALSESLANDFIGAAQTLGLERPRLGN